MIIPISRARGAGRLFGQIFASIRQARATFWFGLAKPAAQKVASPIRSHPNSREPRDALESRPQFAAGKQARRGQGRARLTINQSC